MYRMASSRGSATPRARMKRLLGIHIVALDLAVVPPVKAARSNTSTLHPHLAAAHAAVSPAAPLPTTTTSTTRVHSEPQSAEPKSGELL